MFRRSRHMQIITACGALALLVACQSNPWTLAAHKKGDTVELCLSNGPQCPQEGGAPLTSLSVYRWDNMHDNVLVWDAEPENALTAGNVTGTVTWGKPPQGWVNKRTPPPLACGKAYLVNPGAHYFALKCDGAVTVFDAPQLEQFFAENKSATPVKGDPSKDTMGPE